MCSLTLVDMGFDVISRDATERGKLLDARKGGQGVCQISMSMVSSSGPEYDSHTSFWLKTTRYTGCLGPSALGYALMYGSSRYPTTSLTLPMTPNRYPAEHGCTSLLFN